MSGDAVSTAPDTQAGSRLSPDSQAGSRLEVQHLAKSYGSRKVVKDVSLVVQKGEVVGLLGPNGAGKTTCFYMITGLIPPDSGTIWLDGEDITDRVSIISNGAVLFEGTSDEAVHDAEVRRVYLGENYV